MTRRLRPTLFRLTIIASSMAFVAVAASWAASVSRCDALGWAGWRDQSQGTWHGTGVRAHRHQLLIHYFTGNLRFDDPGNLDGDASLTESKTFWHSGPRDFAVVQTGASTLNRMGFSVRHIPVPVSPSRRCDLYFVTLPHWALLVVFGVAPGIWLRRLAIARRNRVREATGLCPTCGYDLRASGTQCPECGVVRPAIAC